jgi:choline dehydrogenase
MAYHRGTVGSYQRWGDLVGDQSHSFHKILPYSKRLATLTAPELPKRNAPNATVQCDDSTSDSALHGPFQSVVIQFGVTGLQAIGQKPSVDGFGIGILNGGA